MEELKNQTDEKQLLLLLKNGNYKAFQRIYQLYSLRLLGRIIRLVKTEEIAEEILQELFTRVWTIRERIDPDRSFKSFLFLVAQNLVCDHFRRIALDQKHRQDFIANNVENYMHIEEDLLYKQAEQSLMYAIDKLPTQCQKVFRLYKIEGKSYEEISHLLNISKSTVNNHLTKANTILRHELPFYKTNIILVCLFLSKIL